MDDIIIKKAKLTKELTIELEYSRTGATVVEKHQEIAHMDLVEAFKKLHVHYGLMTYIITTKQVKDVRDFDSKFTEDIHVSSYSIGGSDDDQGITISGTRTLPNKKAHNTNTPFYRFEEGEENGYRFMEELQEDVSVIRTEIIEYLGGKHAPSPQLSLDLPEADPDAMERVSGNDVEEDDYEELAEVVAPVKRGRKKKKDQ